VKLGRRIDPESLRKEVNARLPSDIHVLRAAAADPRFHARHAAISRAYVYQVSRRRTAFAKRYVWWVQRELDVERMRRALPSVVGEHDFVRFCDRPKEKKSTRVRVDRAEIAEAGSLILLRFEASNFLWKMVRRLTGALVEVGAGALAAEGFSALIGGSDLCVGKGPVPEWTAPPSGLFLSSVRYEGDPAPGPLEPVFAVP
jgi:tRNA pseudouridine38-40 synthase